MVLFDRIDISAINSVILDMLKLSQFSNSIVLFFSFSFLSTHAHTPLCYFSLYSIIEVEK